MLSQGGCLLRVGGWKACCRSLGNDLHVRVNGRHRRNEQRTGRRSRHAGCAADGDASARWAGRRVQQPARQRGPHGGRTQSPTGCAEGAGRRWTHNSFGIDCREAISFAAQFISPQSRRLAVTFRPAVYVAACRCAPLARRARPLSRCGTCGSASGTSFGRPPRPQPWLSRPSIPPACSPFPSRVPRPPAPVFHLFSSREICTHHAQWPLQPRPPRARASRTR